MEEASPAQIEIRNVSKDFESKGGSPFTALIGVSLRLGAGTATLVRGPSGSGKTTLLSLIGCMTRPTSGRVVLAGQDVTRAPEDEVALLRRSNIGFIFQGNQLVRGASAIANVMLPGVPCPEMNGDLRGSAQALLARLGLGERSLERIERLSGGEQQRVAIARALLNNPTIILADEPTAHLDEQATCGLLDVFAELRAEGKTVLVASHDQSLAESGFFSQVFRLSQGRMNRMM
jgi:putative ABC transport system ATP-binding protein